MRIVDISAYFVYPPMSGGQARIFGFNTAMSRYAKIEQFSFTPVIMRRKTFAHNKNYSEHIYPSLLYTSGVVLLKIFGILNYDFIIPFIFRFKRMPGQLKEALQNADLVQVEHPWLLCWIAKHTNKPVVLVEHNVEYELQKDFFKGSIFQECIVKSIVKTEKNAIEKAKMVFSMCKEDKEKLSRMYRIEKNKLFIVPNGVLLSNYTLKLSKEEARRKLGLRKNSNIVLFVGAKHPPNDEATRFIEKILAPKLPEMLFLIVGNVRKRKTVKNVVCTSRVNDLLPYYRAADLVINPVMSGSGTNLKMFSYFADGLPVVTTKKGLRGIEATPGKDVLVSDTNNFSISIVTLINDKHLQANLHRNSKRIAEKYDWAIITSKAVKHYYNLL